MRRVSTATTATLGGRPGALCTQAEVSRRRASAQSGEG